MDIHHVQMDDIDEQFESAAKSVFNLKNRPSDDQMLHLYGLYKQSLFGNNKTPKPGVFDFKGKEKWNAWKNVSGKGKTKAKHEYINLVEQLKMLE